MREPESRVSRYQPITELNITRSEVWNRLSAEQREAIEVVSKVLPFRTNEYVVRELIDWNRVPDDPIYQMTFVQRGMLDDQSYSTMRDLLARGAAPEEVRELANRIRRGLNPHPDGQLTHNVPTLDGKPLPGLQHKYRETVLFFPGQGQTCHAFCTYCFRWAQFVDLPDLRFQSWETTNLVAYLKVHPEVTDVLVTGGDPLIMKTSVLRRYLEPLLSEELAHVRHIRIGTKALAYWPQRFVSDADADDLLRLFEEVAASGRHLALMAHSSHPVELSPEIARLAVQRIRASGAEIRLQAPVIRRVNDDGAAWADLWRDAVRLGMIPYYMFVERDTGPRQYFEVPLARTLEIFREAYQQVSGLVRSARGPVMSALPGKVRVLGVSEIAGQRCFVLDFLQAREPDWVKRPFFARFDPEATWFDQLKPAFEDDRFFFDRSQEMEHGVVVTPRPDAGRAGSESLTVIKVGGSLLTDGDGLERAASALAGRRRDGGPLLVVASALKGVTDLLELAAIQALDREPRGGPLGDTLKRLGQRHIELARGLGGGALEQVRQELSEVERLVASIHASGELADATYARLLSSGERLSVILLAAALQAAGQDARPITSEEAGLRAVGDPRAGSCDIPASVAGLRRLGSELRRRILVLTGFYGVDGDGGCVLFGRGGSDDTAGAVAAGLDAGRLELWKDVLGFMSADPQEIRDARVIDEISFDEVAQMGAYGSSIVHHRCLEPLRGRSTKVFISSIQGAKSVSGTLLVDRVQRGAPRVVSLVGQRGDSEIRIGGGLDNGGRELAGRVLSLLAEAKIPARPANAEPGDVRFIIAGSDVDRARLVLSGIINGHKVDVRHSPSLVAAVGDGVADDPEIRSRMLSCLSAAGTRGELVPGRSGLSCTVDPDDLVPTLSSLHESFFAAPESTPQTSSIASGDFDDGRTV
jgi:KamA family protein